MSPIYVERDDGYVEMVEQPYDAEKVLQLLLAENPGLLAGAGVDEDHRWLLIDREVPVPDTEDGGGRWSLDHLFVDQNAMPTLVEVKRSSNTQIRREIVGQLIEYGANASVYWTIDAIREAFAARARPDGQSPDEELSEFLGDQDSDDDLEGFWGRVHDNLKAGRVRLVFVADEFPPTMRRIVEFLNGQMDPAEVLAIEVRQFVEVGGERKTLVPSVVGQTEAARAAKGTRSTAKTTEEELLASFERFGHPVAKRLEDLYSFMIANGARRVPGTSSINLWMGEDADEAKANPVSVSFWAKGDGGLCVNFVFMTGKRSDEEMVRLADLLEEVPGTREAVQLSRDKGLVAYCGLSAPEVLGTDEGLEALKNALAKGAQPAE